MLAGHELHNPNPGVDTTLRLEMDVMPTGKRRVSSTMYLYVYRTSEKRYIDPKRLSFSAQNSNYHRRWLYSTGILVLAAVLIIVATLVLFGAFRRGNIRSYMGQRAIHHQNHVHRLQGQKRYYSAASECDRIYSSGERNHYRRTFGSSLGNLRLAHLPFTYEPQESWKVDHEARFRRPFERSKAIIYMTGRLYVVSFVLFTGLVVTDGV